jgi:hypothetical protein
VAGGGDCRRDIAGRHPRCDNAEPFHQARDPLNAPKIVEPRTAQLRCQCREPRRR